MRRGLGLLSATLLLAAAVAVTGSVLVLRLFYTWSLLLSVGYLWVFFNSRGVSINASPLPERSQAGATIRQDIAITGAGRMPRLGLRLRAVNNLPGGDVATTLDVPGRGSARWQVDYPAKRRGRYSLGRFSLGVSDPFGLFRREVDLGQSSDVIIHPQVVPLPPFSLLGLAGAGMSRRMPEALSASASSIREYTNGDSLRHIHWRSTAHTGQYMVKVFDADRSRHRTENYWVILDMARAVHSGQDEESTAEYAVTLAASLARKYLAGGFRFGLIIARGESTVFPAGLGQDHLTAIMDALATIEPGGSFSFPELIARHQGLFSSNSTVVVITPTTSSALTESYHQLTARGSAAAYFLLDGAGFGGASPGSVGRSLTQLGAPVYLLRRSDTFRQALEQAASGATWTTGGTRS
jgi:uncharacterized protein (DUF58 family)